MIINPGLLRFAGKSGSSLVAPGVLRTLSFSRAQVATASTALTPDGVTRTEFAADIPRFNDIARRLLIEGQRTNSIRNPRCEGAVAGTPGTLPTFWSVAVGTTALSTSVVGTGTENGLPYVDIRFFGTPAATAQVQVNHDGTIAASDGQLWTYSIFSRFVAGSLTNVGNATLALNAGTANTNTNYTLTSAALGSTRQTATVTAAGGATTTLPRWRLAVTINLPVDITVRLGAVQLELGAFVSSPIFPSVGTPATSTRGADNVTTTLARLGIGDNGAGTYLTTFMIPAFGGFSQGVITVDIGATTDRYVVRYDQGTGLRLYRTTGGAASPITMLTPAQTVAGTLYRLGMVIQGDGTVRACVDGGAIFTRTGGPTTGLTRLILGATNTNAELLFGEIGTLRVLPYAVSDAELQARVAALPL